jgi:hypothetical protein
VRQPALTRPESALLPWVKIIAQLELGLSTPPPSSPKSTLRARLIRGPERRLVSIGEPPIAAGRAVGAEGGTQAKQGLTHASPPLPLHRDLLRWRPAPGNPALSRDRPRVN